MSLAIWFLPACSANHTSSDTPTSAPSEHRPSTTSEPANTATHCPNHSPNPRHDYPRNGWLYGGGLKIKEIEGWRREPVKMGWISDLSTQTDLVESTAKTRWISMIGIGALNVTDGFQDLEKAADRVLKCYTTPDFFSGLTGYVTLHNEEHRVDGRRGWWLRSKVSVDMQELPDVKGDWVDVIVVDTGSPEYLGVLITSVKIGDEKRTRQVAEALESLSVQ